MTNSQKIYLVTALTDLHAGTGSDYTRNIDRVVQRDYANMPVVRGSGVKGALRGHCRGMGIEHDDIFGAYVQGSGQDEKGIFKPSAVYLDDMRLLAVSCNYNSGFPYVLATCPFLLKRAKVLFGLEPTPVVDSAVNAPELLVGDLQTELKPIADHVYLETNLEDDGLAHAFAKTVHDDKDEYKPPIAVVADDVFLHDILPASLPVVARNSLRRGTSINLWFEEYVPAGSVFAASIAYHHGIDDKEKLVAPLFAVIENTKQEYAATIRMGSGKSVGKGQTQWRLISHSEPPKPKHEQDRTHSAATSDADSTKTSETSASIVALDTGAEIVAHKKSLKSGLISEVTQRVKRLKLVEDLIKQALHLDWITVKEENTLLLRKESKTALNRIPSLMRMSLFGVLSTLNADISADGNDARAKARRHTAQLLALVLKKKYKLTLGESSSNIFQHLLKGSDAHIKADLKLQLTSAFDELKLIAACCEEEEQKNKKKAA